MDYQPFIKTIENFLNGKSLSVDLSAFAFPNNAVGDYLRATAERLCHAFEHYQRNTAGENDFLIALRDFMISYQSTLKLKNGLVPKDNVYGIYLDDQGQYHATLDIDTHLIKHSVFVEQAFPTILTEPPKRDPKYNLHTNAFIRKLTGYEYFRKEDQKLCVFGALNTPKGYTTLISMPTGGGKSLVTQTLSYSEEGLSIVIVPTVSLVIDQVRTSKKIILSEHKDDEIFGYYSGANNIQQIQSAIEKKTARMLFISPEALIKNDQFSIMIENANQSRYLKNLIIDEAHLVKKWGDAFRTDYLCLEPWRRTLLTVNEDLRTFLMSATFEDTTVKVLKRMFSDYDRWIEIRCDSLRREPRFIYINEKSNTQKKHDVLSLIAKMPHPMILYVNEPSEAERWKKYLEQHGYLNVQTFTGDTRSNERKRLIDAWVDNQFEIMIATSAFGVGVDKPDVRTVIHLMMPDSADTYYQELGRGGRDGLPSLSIMCITYNEAVNYKTNLMKPETIWGRWRSMYEDDRTTFNRDGSVTLDASVKPRYNKKNILDEGNEKDQSWNITALALLNRYGLITIKNMQVTADGHYEFTIVCDPDIAIESSRGEKKIADIRQQEWKTNTKQVELLQNAVRYAEHQCWSNMFYETYPLVSEYCAGCNYHEEVNVDDYDSFPLRKEIRGKTQRPVFDREKYFSVSREALFLYHDEEAMVRRISKMHPDVIVLDDREQHDEIYFMAEERPELEIFNFNEVRELLSNGSSFYISGLIVAIYGTSNPAKEYRLILKWLKSHLGCVIHVSKIDFLCNGQDKYISDTIDGDRIREE